MAIVASAVILPSVKTRNGLPALKNPTTRLEYLRYFGRYTLLVLTRRLWNGCYRAPFILGFLTLAGCTWCVYEGLGLIESKVAPCLA
jgi:hypothetical protein